MFGFFLNFFNFNLIEYFQLDNANQILDQAQQPYDFLITTIRNKDGQLKKVQDTIEGLEKQLR